MLYQDTLQIWTLLTIRHLKFSRGHFVLASLVANSNHFCFMQRVTRKATELVSPATEHFFGKNWLVNWGKVSLQRVSKCVPSASQRIDFLPTWNLFISSYRSFYFVFESEVTFRGIKLYRFTGPDELYLSGDVYLPNKGFCVPPECLPTGLLNISRCQPLSKWRWPFRLDFRVSTVNACYTDPYISWIGLFKEGGEGS